MHITYIYTGEVTRRHNCYYGKNCRTQKHNREHAKYVYHRYIQLPCKLFVYAFSGHTIISVNKQDFETAS